ncbi:uncharacterized protein LOC131245193 [Magnolia sinica]|uniref:uncharacterized protein LOC131245193 n=1 Tax=Magnolia sinica TaxID=86752 RepID=UPI00265B58F8|nr:uncharacterized protein LOC131245193 [Magnolia sinica]
MCIYVFDTRKNPRAPDLHKVVEKDEKELLLLLMAICLSEGLEMRVADGKKTIATFFSCVMSAIGGKSAGPGRYIANAVVNVYIKHEKKFAFVDMRNVEEVSNAMALDGITFEALVVKLREGTGPNANTGVVTGVLATVGELARVGGFGMKQYLCELMPVIVEALLDGAAVIKREVAVATLGQVVQSTGYVIAPYKEYPQLLGLLLKLLKELVDWVQTAGGLRQPLILQLKGFSNLQCKGNCGG